MCIRDRYVTSPCAFYILVSIEAVSVIYLCPYSSVNVMITTSGSPTVGEVYTLECSVTGSTGQPTIIWLDDGYEITSSATRMVSATTVNSGYSSTLTFTPLSASDAGMFMCKATLGSVTMMDTTTISVHSKLSIHVTYMCTHNVSLPPHSLRSHHHCYCQWWSYSNCRTELHTHM